MEQPSTTVTFAELAGKEFMLDAVDHDTTEIKKWSDEFEQASCVRFRLDGQVYIGVENPSDGYRSSLDYLARIGAEMTNVFPPVRVKAVLVDRSPPRWSGDDGEACDLLVFRCIETDKDILTVGTDRSDDYYPSYVANFRPENMPTNAGVREQGMAVKKPLPTIPAGPWDWAANDERLGRWA